MNKKFTMVCASLLLASAFSVNAQTVVSTPEGLTKPTIESAISDTEVVEGYKFYFGDSQKNLYKVVVADNKATMADRTAEYLDEAAIFEVRNLKKVDETHAQFELYVKGVKVYNSAKTVSSFYVELKGGKFLPKCLSEIYEVEFGSQGNPFYTGLVPFTTQLLYSDADLNNYNKNNTTFSFDFTKEELVGNEFNQLVPYTKNFVTYFVKGEKAEQFNLDKPETFKGISILAVDHKNRYGLNTSKPGEGYKLRMVDAEKFLLNEEGKLLSTRLDSLTLAGFTNILEADQLNKAKELTLNVAPKAGLLQDVDVTTVFNIAAVKSSTSDTKAYVTTVAQASSSWAVVKNAILGDNTYFPASEFLKEGMRTVAILNVTGKPGDENYYKYLVENASTYKAASELDFSMPQNQWVFTNFDGKYTITLKNRLTQAILTLNVAKSENGYKTKLQGKDVEVKFLDLAATATDGYTTFTEEQVKDGVNLSFYGETELAGKKEFFAVNTTGTKVEPALDSEGAVVLMPIRNVDAKNVDKYKQYLSYAALNTEGKIVSATDTLVVPTYVLATEVKDGKAVKAMKTTGVNYSISDASAATSYALAKNMLGQYSLVPVTGRTVKEIAENNVTGVTYNSTKFTFANVGRQVENAEVNAKFANVAVTSVNKLNESLPAVPGHYTFDNLRGSINVTDVKGINEGALATEGQVFWLDTADIEKEVPSFYISFGKDGVAARNYMFNPIDSAKVFDEHTADFEFNDVYYYGEDHKGGILKAAFASTTQEKGKDLADAFKFNITLAKGSSDEYVITSVKDKNLKVAQKNGVVILTKDDAMAFTVNKADAPTSNEGVSTSEVAVVAQNGSVVVKNAAGKNVVVSTILGQVVANEVLTSDNATINVPAGIVVVSVDGESFKVNVR